VFCVQTQKRYWTQESSNPRPDPQICVKKHRTQGLKPLVKFQVLGLRRQIHQIGARWHRNARIKSAFCKPRLVEFQSTWTQTPDSSNWRPMAQKRKDQIRVLQTKTCEIPKYLDSDARFIKLAPDGTETQGSNPRSANQDL